MKKFRFAILVRFLFSFTSHSQLLKLGIALPLINFLLLLVLITIDCIQNC